MECGPYGERNGRMRQITIARIGSHRTVQFAVRELCRYLKRLDPQAVIEQRVYQAYDETVRGVLWTGLAEKAQEIRESENVIGTDDAILVEVKDYQGVILGSNERSVLIAVYRFLKELGIGWLHPGEKGELIPHKILEHCQVAICEKADMRYRVMCIEGAVSYEHIRRYRIFMCGWRICAIISANVKNAGSIVRLICMWNC